MRFLFVDRIVQLEPAEYVCGLKHITSDDYYLSSDHLGNLHFMPSLIGETLGQLAAWNVMQYHDFGKRPVAGVVAQAVLHRPAFIGETLLLESWIDALDDTVVQYHSTACIGDEVVFTLEGALGPLLPMDDFIDPTVVRQQFSEIYRPGDWAAIKHSVQMKSEAYAKPNVVAQQMNFDRILDCEPQKRLHAEKRITRAASYFPDHFPRRPVLPMSVLLECQLNLGYEFIQRSNYAIPYQFESLRRIKMNDFIYPGDVVETQLVVREHADAKLVLHCLTTVNQRRVCVLDMIFTDKL